MPRPKSQKQKREEFEGFCAYMESWRGPAKMRVIRDAGDIDAAIAAVEALGWTQTADRAREWVASGGTAPTRDATVPTPQNDMVREWLEGLDRRVAEIERQLGLGSEP